MRSLILGCLPSAALLCAGIWLYSKYRKLARCYQSLNEEDSDEKWKSVRSKMKRFKKASQFGALAWPVPAVLLLNLTGGRTLALLGRELGYAVVIGGVVILLAKIAGKRPDREEFAPLRFVSFSALGFLAAWAFAAIAEMHSNHMPLGKVVGAIFHGLF